MPELPEVETMRRGILPLVGRQVAHVERTPCKRRPIAIRPRIDLFRRRTEEKFIAAIDRAGKRVVIWLSANPKPSRSTKVQRMAAHVLPVSPGEGRGEGAGMELSHLPGEEAIIIEPRMTGLVLLASPPTLEHLRFRMRLSKPTLKNARSTGEAELLFWDRRGLGIVSLLSAAEYATKFQGETGTLGPDALRITPEQLRERLRHSRRAIKVALLDQRAVAGIGNLYASEMLHVAHIHPAARCHRLKSEQWARLHAAMRLVLEEAIRYEGSTLSDGTYRNALNESGGYQVHHRVYDRADQPCPTCGRGTIQRIVQAQRSTFFCPHCQRR